MKTDQSIFYYFLIEVQLFTPKIDLNIGEKIHSLTYINNINGILNNYLMQNYPEHNIIDIDSGFSKSYKLHNHTSVFEAKAYALFEAILYVWKNQLKKVVVIKVSAS